MVIAFPEFNVLNKFRNISKNLFIIDVKLSNFEKSKDRSIFSNCHGDDGFKIQKFKQKMILSYLNNPTIEGWDEIYNFKITPNKNLWDAWNKVATKKLICIKKTDKLSEKWIRIPKPEELVLGINKTIESEYSKLAELKTRLLLELENIEEKYKKFISKYA